MENLNDLNQLAFDAIRGFTPITKHPFEARLRAEMWKEGFLAGSEHQARQQPVRKTLDEANIELLKEYQSRLNEVYQNAGALTGIDVDYCLLMTLHDNGFEIEPLPTTNN